MDKRTIKSLQVDDCEKLNEYYSNGDMSENDYREALLLIRIDELYQGKLRAIREKLRNTTTRNIQLQQNGGY